MPQMREAFFREWDSQRVYDETIRQTLEAKFGFAYPYAYLEELPVKVGVSELKKRKYADEEEIRICTLSGTGDRGDRPGVYFR